MAKELTPVTPGEILLEEFLKPLGLSQNKLARELDVPAARFNSTVKGVRRITVDMALRLGRFFKTGPELWLNMQQRYDLRRVAAASSMLNGYEGLTRGVRINLTLIHPMSHTKEYFHQISRCHPR